VRTTIEQLHGAIDVDGAVAAWEAAMAADWTGRDVWIHGDVTGSNLLMRDDRLSGVIDFGCAAVGDPACDLTVAWTMFERTSRRRFVETVKLDSGTWARARGWALWKALIALAGRSASARAGTRFGWRWDAQRVIDEVISDFRSLL
jgi:aminoglycoside phosphotransferase (APT) family kinase protein